jgi:hypothetical protein
MIQLGFPMGRFPTVPAGHPIAVVNANEDELAFVDAATGRKQNAFKGDMSRVRVVFAADNQKTLVAGNNDRTQTVWHKTEDGRSVAFQWPRQEMGLACSPDGTMVAANFSDKDVTHKDVKVRLWDVASQKEIATFDGLLGHSAGLNSFPDSRTLATVTADGVKLWDLTTHQARRTIAGFYPIAISPDGKLLATSDATNGVTLWECATGQARVSLHLPGRGEDMVFSPDGSKVWLRFMYQDSRANNLFYWLDYLFRRLGVRGFTYGSSPPHEEAAIFDVTTGLECARVPFDRSHVLFGDDKTLATFSRVNGTIQLWDLPPRRAVHPILAWACLGLALILTGTWWYDRRRCAAMPSEAVALVH